MIAKYGYDPAESIAFNTVTEVPAGLIRADKDIHKFTYTPLSS